MRPFIAVVGIVVFLTVCIDYLVSYALIRTPKSQGSHLPFDKIAAEGKSPYSIPFPSQSRSLSRLFAQKYDSKYMVRVSVVKPLGVSLEEVEVDAEAGVYVGDIDEGSIKSTNQVRKGDYLLEVNGVDVKRKGFDAVLDLLIKAPENKPLNLVFMSPSNIFKGEAIISVSSPSGNKVIKSLKGLNLRRVLLDNKFPVYDMKGSMVNCGGSGSCGTCAVNVKDNKDWESRPDFESARLKKYDTSARLSCNTIIEGDCTVELQPPKKS